MPDRKLSTLNPMIDASPKAGQEKAPPDPLPLSIPAALPLRTDDPNFGPDWDWTVDEPHDLFALTQSGLQTFENVSLPYFADNGPAADDFNSDAPGVRDILPEDGWVLLFRDFGTPQRGAVFPRFILYNRFRGLLRLFYFNPHFPEAFTYGLVTLQKQSASAAFALLTFTDQTNTTLADFDPQRRELFIGRLEPVTWNYADFFVVGFDPDLPDDARLQFEIAGVRESDISLEGDLTLEQVLNKTNLVASGSGQGGSALAIGESTAGAFKNLDALKKAINNLPGVSLADVSGAISAGIALFKLFAGGSKPQQTQLLKFKGNVNLSGSIRLQGAVGSFLLRVPGARHLSQTDLPFYDKPLGIFNLRAKPAINARVRMELSKCRNTDKVGPKILTLPFPRRHQHILKRPQVLVNPHAGLKATVEVAFVRPNGALDFAGSSGADGYFPLKRIPAPVDLLKGPANCDDPPPPLQKRKVAIRLTIVPHEPHPDFTPVSIVKLYPVEYSSQVVMPQ